MNAPNVAPPNAGMSGFHGEAGVQAAAFEALGCPLHARLLRALLDLFAREAEAAAVLERAWRTRVFHAKYERPLLLCAALRFVAMRDPGAPLAALIGVAPDPATRLDDETLRGALRDPQVEHSLRTRFVQTNEVSRALAWRYPLSLLREASPSEAGVPPQPTHLVDLGCSAGLVLTADRVPLTWQDGEGAPLPLATVPVTTRMGLDRHPVDLRAPDAAAWLRALVWPSQRERLAHLDLALARATEALARGEVQLFTAEAEEMPSRLTALADPEGERGPRVFAYQTVVSAYLSQAVLDRYTRRMHAWLLAYPGRAFWSELERAAGGPGAELRVHTARDGAVHSHVLGSCEYHPRTLVVDRAAVASFRALAC